MRHSGMKIVYVFVLIVSVLMAFFVLQDLDEESPTGESATIWIQDAPNSGVGMGVARQVTSFANGHRVSIVREVWDFRKPLRLRHLYIAAGNPRSTPASWLEHGFPSFGHYRSTETHPFEQIGNLDPRGTYRVYGSRYEVEALRAEFAKLGLTGDLVRPIGTSELIQRYILSSLGWAVLVAALSVMLTAGASVLISAKGYGVMRLQGLPFHVILQLDVRRMVGFWLISTASVVTITLTFLGLYNGFARLGLFSAVAGGLASVLCLLAMITHVAALALVNRTDVLRGLKGEVVVGPAVASIYLLRVIAAFLVFAIGGAALLSTQEFLRKEEGQKRFAELGAASYIELPGSRTVEAAEEMSLRVGQWLRQADKRGQIISIYRWDLQQLGFNAPGHELLVVNDTFLAEQPILDPSGKRYSAESAGRVRVIVPRRLHKYAQAITRDVPGIIHPGDEGRLVRQAGVDQVWARDHQTVFTFGARSEGMEELLLLDPVVAVVPNGSHLVSDDDHTAGATHGGIIFRNPQDIVAALGRDVPREDIAAINLVASRAAEEYSKSAHELLINGSSLVVALVVLFITGIGVCLIYARKNAQAVFAKHISGWSFWMVHRRLLGVDVLVAVALLGWAVWDNWNRLRAVAEFADMGVPPPPSLTSVNWWELVPAAGVGALALALLVVALAFAHRRIVTEHASDV